MKSRSAVVLGVGTISFDLVYESFKDVFRIMRLFYTCCGSVLDATNMPSTWHSLHRPSEGKRMTHLLEPSLEYPATERVHLQRHNPPLLSPHPGQLSHPTVEHEQDSHHRRLGISDDVTRFEYRWPRCDGV